VSRDVIADFITIVRNGIMRSKYFVVADYSALRHGIASLLQEEGYVSEVVVENENNKKRLKVVLKYVDGESAIHEIIRVSKPSLRVYKGINDVKPVISGLGISILTTSKGLMTDKAAKKANVGGELICTVW